MSRTRPPNLQRWSCLRESSYVFTTTARPSLVSAIDNYPPRIFNNRNSPHPRLFSTTPYYNAVPAPSTKRRNAQRSGFQRPVFPADELLSNTPGDSARSGLLNARLQDLDKNAFTLTSAMIHDGLVDSSMTSKKVKRIGTELLKGAFLSVPSAAIIQRICQAENVNMDTVFVLGRVISRGHKEIFNWMRDACELADSRMAITYSAALQLRRCHDSDRVYDAEVTREPRHTLAIERVKSLAGRRGDMTCGMNKDDPRVLLIYAKYLGLLGQYKQGLSLVRDVLRMIEPRHSEPKMHDDITISSLIEPPWDLYLWLNREIARKSRRNRGQDLENIERQSDSEEGDVLRLGAVTYQDPVALMYFAQRLGREQGIDQYEEYMGQAAAGGKRDACRKLANFYYHISLGNFPRPYSQASRSVKIQDLKPGIQNPGLEDSKSSKGFLHRLSIYFRPRSSHEYRSLAREWYEVAFALGCVRSGSNLVLMHQQEGNAEEAETMMKAVTMHNTNDPTSQNIIQRAMDSYLADTSAGPALEDLDL